jgi:5-methylcytosine-specific restriction endonuclease McrA
MVAYKKNYLKHFGYGEQDMVPCEVCGKRAGDIHHIHYKSLGGSDSVGNLMALCRRCHDMAHDRSIAESYLQAVHDRFMN